MSEPRQWREQPKSGKTRLLCLLGALAVTIAFGWFRLSSGWAIPGSPLNNHFDVQRVAHAGGGIEGATYTNSYEALNQSYEHGFRYFELDFVHTSDGHLVCLHDWQSGFRSRFGFEVSEALSLAEFLVLADKQVYRNCSLGGLGEWMLAHPEAVIITDIKGDNIEGLRQVLQSLPSAPRRVIPQVYNPAEISRVKQMGFQRAIWTLYRYPGDDKDVLAEVRHFDPGFAVTMPRARAEGGLALKLLRLNVPSFVHTINDDLVRERLVAEHGVTEVYTDFLSP